MNRKSIIIFLVISLVLEVLFVYVILGRLSDTKQDPVRVNECIKSVEMNYGNPEKYSHVLNYVVTDEDGRVIYKTGENLPETINQAIEEQCLILDYSSNDKITGKIIFENTLGDRLIVYRNSIIVAVSAIILLQLAVITIWLIYIRKNIISPFNRLNDFAVRVASGNLEIPLEMDKGHIFGEFTEAFDLMRSELKKARSAEQKANEEKKEIIAKLSHDIKTPVASIKSTSEMGLVAVKDEKAKEMFSQINIKTDQITTLVDNLFNSSVKELTEISVNPVKCNASVIEELIRNSDYLLKVVSFTITRGSVQADASASYGLEPSGTYHMGSSKTHSSPRTAPSGSVQADISIYIDRLRLQQAFDNIFLNSYKYADTEISVRIEVDGSTRTTPEKYLSVKISDKGPGVKEEEIPLLKEKYKRGSNSEGKDGAGLGLYLTNYYIKEMGGFIEIKNENPGLSVTIHLRII